MNESVPQRLEKSATVFACVYCSLTDLFPAYCLIANYTSLRADILTIWPIKVTIEQSITTLDSTNRAECFTTVNATSLMIPLWGHERLRDQAMLFREVAVLKVILSTNYGKILQSSVFMLHSLNRGHVIQRWRFPLDTEYNVFNGVLISFTSARCVQGSVHDLYNNNNNIVFYHSIFIII